MCISIDFFFFTFKVSREFCVNIKNNIIYPGLNAEDRSKSHIYKLRLGTLEG